MKINLPRFCGAALLGAALMLPMALTPTALLAQDRKNQIYHDKAHNDDHEWTSHENLAYQRYNRENHRKNVQFSRLNDENQQAYWGWRHDHSDAVLKINIH
jgi:hypothetical protein